MKTIFFAAMALAVAIPAASQAQPAASQPPAGHAGHGEHGQHGQHAQHGQQHGQGSPHQGGHAGHHGCCCPASRSADCPEDGEAHACCHSEGHGSESREPSAG